MIADRFIKTTPAEIRHGGSRACFVPSLDIIQLPPRSAFIDDGNYYATTLHELGHWSGDEKRLNRDLKSRFGTQAYVAEELIAELTSAFLCAHLGVNGELRHASYIDRWIALNRAIFTAASKASQAADYLRSFSRNEIHRDRRQTIRMERPSEAPEGTTKGISAITTSSF